MLIVRQVVNYFWQDPTFASALIKEVGMWLVAVALLIIVRMGECLPLRSIGLGTARWWKSVLWGLLLGIVCLLVAVGLVALTGYTGGELGKAMEKLPVWLISLIVLRAGVVEELCYRGYAIERLHALGLPRGLAAGVPLLIFGVGHWTGGWANIVIALVLGGILALFFIWRRDLAANMIGHWLVDFVGNVLPNNSPARIVCFPAGSLTGGRKKPLKGLNVEADFNRPGWEPGDFERHVNPASPMRVSFNGRAVESIVQRRVFARIISTVVAVILIGTVLWLKNQPQSTSGAFPVVTDAVQNIRGAL